MVDNNSDRESIVVSIVERRGGKKKEEKNEVAGWQRLALAGLGRGGGRGGRILDFDPFFHSRSEIYTNQYSFKTISLNIAVYCQ